MGEAAKTLARPDAAEEVARLGEESRASRKPVPPRSCQREEPVADDPRSRMPPALPGSPAAWFHIVGVGGAGMNGIATLLAAMGHMVSGSDLQASPVLERLDGLGVETFIGHEAANVAGADFVAFSTAIRSDNVELTEARRRGTTTLRRAELLAAICRSRRTLAVSGTHGKTTTTAMLAAVLNEAGFDPGFLVGGELAEGRGGSGWGSGQWLVVEADEADGTFLQLGAEGVVVTNVEPDHLDYFGDVDALASAFEAFIRQAPGPRVVCLDDKTAASLARAVPGVITYGTAEDADYCISAPQLSASGSRFEVSVAGEEPGPVRASCARRPQRAERDGRSGYGGGGWCHP